MTSTNALHTSIKKNGIQAFVLGFPKCGTTAFAEWLNSSTSLELSKPKESYQFCPEFNDVQNPFTITWNDSDRTVLRVEACTWNIYSTSLLKTLKEIPHIKVFIITRELHEVFPSWIKQVEKAGFGTPDISRPDQFWDTSKKISGLSNGKELLNDYRTTLCHGHWVDKWMSTLGPERVLLIDNNELRDKKKISSLSRRIDFFLNRKLKLPGHIEEKNTYSNKRFPTLSLIYRSRPLKRVWFAIEGIKPTQKMLVTTRYFIKERILMKKAIKQTFDLSFIKSDIRFQQEMKSLDSAFLLTRGTPPHDS